MRRLLAPALMLAAAPAAAQAPAPRTILFIGNSFTEGAHAAVRGYRAGSVSDLNGTGVGGVPALFKRFADEAGLAYAVSLETQGGQTLGFHLAERRQRIERAWDVVVLQDYSTFSQARPGDPASHIRDANALATLFTRANRTVRVELVATWSRADLVYRPGSPWSGAAVGKMAADLYAGSLRARAAGRDIDGVVPVGLAWNRAFADGVADSDPYDGTAFGQLDLWAFDQYHASVAGYYLEALTIFGKVTGVDPRTLGAGERAADDLGLSPAHAVALQRIAAETLAAERGR